MTGAQDSDVSTPKYAVLYCIGFVYLVSLVVVAYYARRRKAEAEAAGGKLQAHYGGSFSAPLLILTTFSTVYSGFTVTGVPEEAFKKGFISIRWIGATIVIVASMMVIYPRLRRLAVERRYTNPNDFIADRFGTMRVRMLGAACGVVPMLIYVTAQMISFAALVQGLSGGAIPRWASILILVCVLLVFEKLGGMNSVVLTDAVQSVIMLVSFLVVPFALGAAFGFVPAIAAPDCGSLLYVRERGTDPSQVPLTCTDWPAHTTVTADGACVPAGCIAAVRPEFYKNPGFADQANILFFLVNMIGAPLQPHMIQRAYIAADDRALRLMMGAMLLAPFLAQTPGIIMGITKAAWDPTWPQDVRKQTAFSSVCDALSSEGGWEYLLVSVMTCATMAAIMSTADSAIMGASSLAIDMYRSLVSATASEGLLVRIGELTSVVMCGAAFGLAMVLTVSQMGSIIIFQNGMLMQLLPVYGLGLFFDINEQPIFFGLAAGLLALVVLVLAQYPMDSYVPLVNVSVFVNFAVVVAAIFIAPGEDKRTIAATSGNGDEANTTTAEAGFDGVIPAVPMNLNRASIKAHMASISEPSKRMIAFLLVLVFVSIPWYGRPGTDAPIIWGLPQWGFVQIFILVIACIVGLVTLVRWQPQVDLPCAATEDGEAKCDDRKLELEVLSPSRGGRASTASSS